MLWKKGILIFSTGFVLLTCWHSLPNAWANPLHDAAGAGDISKVKQLIQKGADINARDLRERTPIFWAQKRGHKEVAQLLRKHEAIE